MFKKEINMESREEMVAFLKGHFRYSTVGYKFDMKHMSIDSVGILDMEHTSYANNVKIHNLNIPEDVKAMLHELLYEREVYDQLDSIIADFEKNYSYEWQVEWGGQRDGYLVLHSGVIGKHKSYCTNCGQINYNSVEESGDCKCGRCGKETRVNVTTPVYLQFSTNDAIDQDADFDSWDMEKLRQRVKVVMDFDRLCDDIIAKAVCLAGEYEIKEETYYTEEKVKVVSKRSTM